MELKIIKKQDDPVAMRISIGGDLKNAYCVYRGNLKDIKILLKSIVRKIEELMEELPISDDMGKRYA